MLGSRQSGDEVQSNDGREPTAQDEAAIALAARDDPRCFLPLYERYVGPVYRYCWLRLHDATAAEDATSEVFVKALERLNGYRGGSFPAWLFAIARNVVIDTYRRRPTAPLELATSVLDQGESPEASMLALAEHAALLAALDALTAEQRAVIDLQLAGLDGPHIAAALEKSPAAVKMLRLRAVERLGDALRTTGWKGALDA